MDGDPAEGPSSITYMPLQRSSPPAGRALHKRHALVHTVSDNNTWTTLFTQTPTTYLATETRPQKQLKRTLPKKVPVLVKSTSHLMDIESELSSSASPRSSTSPTLDLRPCHICHTAPKRKKDLENYDECRRCQEHTCFICVRQCGDGCREKICRKCCVEVGEEGDTLCLDCYDRNVNS
ncbi:hypothetical protein K505DRAFT_330226 [Melanomma pulvis-pyrius CBS 109.77]|uniref:Uncharacterized protein n=1 Tax=Melanomma pulvis-pyrius CBS 109.77 TaxID=1314802 RepID=A0A6A6WRN8_9PLEO|nr:hypothetical protein K505DRAFT_330226 [Melanomma pulvis-pyrius CBS 109.77]